MPRRRPRPGADDEAGWLECEARAKVNLRLRIFPPTADGYHPIETLFCRIDLADRVRLRLRPAPGVELALSGPVSAPAGRDNVAVQAAERFASERSLEGGVVIQLDKRIPAAAGLGGGSSDAAAVLGLLARATVDEEEDELLRIAAGLGADVPFFASDAAFALAWGRGDRLLRLPALEPRPMLLLVPEAGVSTARAYALWDERRARIVEPAGAAVFSGTRLESWDGVAELATNDFEACVFEAMDGVAELKTRLSETGAFIALLSGSGSTVFGVYRDVAARDGAASRLREELAGVRLITACGPV